MGRRKRNPDGEGSTAALTRMTKVASLVAASSDEKLKSAFLGLAGGADLYNIFLTALNDEMEALFGNGGQDQEAAEALADQLVFLSGEVRGLSEHISSLNDDMLFRILDIVSRNFNGRPALDEARSAASTRPSAPPVTTPPLVAPPKEPEVKVEKKSLKKKFSTSPAKEVQVQEPATPAPQQTENHGPPANSMPPRPSRVGGMF